MKSFVLEFFIAARFANLAVSLPQYQFASHRHCMKVIDKYVQIVILIDSQHYICYTM
jgi:hypothetical protein